MLLELQVKNLALIEQARIEFGEGLNILTGETGAGKSILIGSVNMALGGKVSRDSIRQGAENAYIELLFSVDSKEQREALEALDITVPEDGTLILIGATTENPYFEVNGALLSRSRIFELKPLEKEDIKELICRAVSDTERGMGIYNGVIEPDALEFLADASGGDARAALNAVELGILTTERSADGKIHIDLDAAQECIQKRAVRYDKNGDAHYDTISAFIKSMRGSDPDAALYYLARIGSESVRFS